MAFRMIYVMLFFAINQAIQSTSVGTCPGDYSIIAGQCLALIRSPKSHKDAEIACNRRAGTLAVPRDPQGLWDYYKQQKFEYNVMNKYNLVWVGASDAKEEGVWRWSTGELIPDGFPWMAGEPNNYGGNEHFLNVQKSGYSDHGGSETAFYICEPRDKSAVASTTEGPFLTEITQMATNSSVSSPGVNNERIFIIVLAICLLFTIILSVTLGVLLKRARAIHQNCPTQAHHQPNEYDDVQAMDLAARH